MTETALLLVSELATNAIRHGAPPVRLSLRLELERVGASIEGASDRVDLLMANLEEAPGHVPTVDALTNVLGSTHRNGQLADVLGVEAEKVENLSERPEAAALWSRLGRVAESAIGDRARAIAAHERAAALVTAAPTLDALGRLCMESGQAEAATNWLDQLLEIAAASERPSVALRLAQAYLAIDRRHRAIACLERALVETPSAQSVRTALIDLHWRVGEYISRKIESAAEPGRRSISDQPGERGDAARPVEKAGASWNGAPGVASGKRLERYRAATGHSRRYGRVEPQQSFRCRIGAPCA